ncbi:MAG TPA: hypothetical protein VGQ51_16565 [Puia sp.]|nr:hypothetical protein [Puia sp.]
MRTRMNGARFPVELIGKAIANSRPVRSVVQKLKHWLVQADISQGQAIRMMMAIGGLIVILVLIGLGRHMAPHYSAIQPVVTLSRAPQQPRAKAFTVLWDSLMADPATKRRWDSLITLRPGLMDTVRRLERMDSAVRQR